MARIGNAPTPEAPSAQRSSRRGKTRRSSLEDEALTAYVHAWARWKLGPEGHARHSVIAQVFEQGGVFRGAFGPRTPADLPTREALVVERGLCEIGRRDVLTAYTLLAWVLLDGQQWEHLRIRRGEYFARLRDAKLHLSGFIAAYPGLASSN